MLSDFVYADAPLVYFSFSKECAVVNFKSRVSSYYKNSKVHFIIVKNFSIVVSAAFYVQIFLK